MNILCIGDVVGSQGCQFLRAHLPALKKTKAIDLVIANGENSADGNGITPDSARYLLDSGVDVITTGNHSFRRGRATTCTTAARCCCARPTTRRPPRAGACAWWIWAGCRWGSST